MAGSARHPALLVLHRRQAFWDGVIHEPHLGRWVLALGLFIAASGALYGAALPGIRDWRLTFYVAVKVPLLFLGTTSLVMVLNWMVAQALDSGLRFAQVMAITFGAMAVACWILAAIAPITFFFAVTATSLVKPTPENAREMLFSYNCLLMTHVCLIALAGVAGNATLIQGLRRSVARGCSAMQLYWCWIAAYALVGCQMSWILRPFVCSPWLPIVFLRPTALEGNFFETVLLQLIPNLLRGVD